MVGDARVCGAGFGERSVQQHSGVGKVQDAEFQEAGAQ